jgi:hypothetical protein
MKEFFAWLSSNPSATTLLTIVLVVIAASVVLIYLVAFFQGREISLWPPKIGPKPATSAKKVNPENSGLIPDEPTTAEVLPETITIPKLALYNLWCETIQRICYAIVENPNLSMTDIRVSLFSVDHQSDELCIVGRYPLPSNKIPPIKYKIGQGNSGIAASENRIVIKENLPIWDDNPSDYIKEMSRFNLDENVIRSWHVKARSYYGLPIEYRDDHEGVHVVKFVVNIDSILPTISSKKTSSQMMVKIINTFTHNQRQLLVDGFSENGSKRKAG